MRERREIMSGWWLAMADDSWSGHGVVAKEFWVRRDGVSEDWKEREIRDWETKRETWDREWKREKVVDKGYSEPNKIIFLFFQWCYNAILHAELHYSTIANFFAIVYIYNSKRWARLDLKCQIFLTFGICNSRWAFTNLKNHTLHSTGSWWSIG